MVPTHALLAALAALADPTPTPSLPAPDDPVLAARGEQMRFVHPVFTNPYMPAAQSKAPHTDDPKKSGSGSGNRGSGSSGSSGSTGSTASSKTTSSMSLAELAAALAAAQATNGQSGSSGGTGSQPTTDPTNPTVLSNPTDQTTAAVMPTADLFPSPTPTTATGGSTGPSPVVGPESFDPPANSPVSTPEPGTILLFVVGASIGGGAALKKWIRRKK